MKVALSSALLNFLLYSALVLLGFHPIVALTISTLVLLLYSFFAYRHLVFR
jgi:putative flippase GtrA